MKKKEIKSAEIVGEFAVGETYEISVDWNGYNYLIIYGSHINGWFAAIPNWETCAEISEPDDVFYNTEKLSKALDSANAGRALVEAISVHWEYTKNKGKEMMNEPTGREVHNA